MASEDPSHKQYWRANIRIVLILLAVWFLAGYVLPMFLVDTLNQVTVGGFKLGFWFGQQGSIVIFILLILIYAVYADRLDKKFNVNEEEN